MFAFSSVRFSLVHSRLPIKSLGLGSNGLFIAPWIFSLIFHKGLTRLNLSGNNLDQFGSIADGGIFDWSTFPPMPNLTSLILQNCLISDVYDDVLDTLPALTHVDARRNKIKSLSGLLKPDLEYLDISHQCIDSECCEPYDNQDNCWKSSEFNIGDTDGFPNMTKLRELKMSGLHAIDLTRDRNKYNESFFRDLSNLKELELDRSDLEYLAEYTFQGLHNLKRLNLSKNWHLETLPNDVFSGLNKVEWLDLSYCPKAFRNTTNKAGETFAFKLPTLRVLNLTCSLIQKGKHILCPEDCFGPGQHTALDTELH